MISITKTENLWNKDTKMAKLDSSAGPMCCWFWCWWWISREKNMKYK